MENERPNKPNELGKQRQPNAPNEPNPPDAAANSIEPNQTPGTNPIQRIPREFDPTVLMDIPPAAVPATLPSWIAGYRMIRKLGEGGMGVVYEVEQQSPRRSVALKVIRGGPFVDEHSVRLFHREAQSLARLRHPGIAAIYEAGRTESGQRFFTMELVSGIPLDRYLDSHPLGETELRDRTKERLSIFFQICEAINYAHQRGVIHRDIKPSNIVVVREPDTDAGPTALRRGPRIKILDFGLARITDLDAPDAIERTRAGQIQGSLPCMSPEQASGSVDEIDLRTDVYSLGIILYEMLTDRPPYDIRGLKLHEALRVIREQPPQRPGAHFRHLRGDLDTIVCKALEKEPGRRYQSALALAEDLERFQTDQPILAHPPSASYQLRKLIARHRPAFAGAAVILVLLVAFGATMSVMFQQQRRERMRADAARREAVIEAEKAKQVTVFLQRMLASVDPGNALGRDVTVREILDEAARTVARDLADQPEVAAAVRSTIGLTYMALGLYEQADSHLRSALAARESLLGMEDLDVAESLNDLAALLWRQGEYAQAESLITQALVMQRHLLGNENAEVAASLNNLGMLRKDRGRYAQAESLCGQALALRRKLFGTENTEIAVSLSNLATLQQVQGKLVEAEASGRDALAIRRRLLGDRHPDVALSLNNLALTLQAESKYAEAEDLMRESLVMGKAILGEGHPSVASTLNNLGTVLSYEGKYAEAESLYREALRLYRKQFGEEHPVVASALNNLAGLFQTVGQPEKAEPLYRQTLAMRRKLLGPRHPAVATSLSNLALVLQDQGKLAEAEPLFRQCLEMRRALLGSGHPHTANALFGLGSFLLQKGDAREAEPLLRECVAIRRKAVSSEPWQLALAKNALGASLAAQRRYSEAESLLVGSTPVITGSPAPSLQRKREALRRTISLYEAMGRPQAAVVFRSELDSLGR
jgi:serine/threonine protein kinase/Tfp pilus assembly protein PilF